MIHRLLTVALLVLVPAVPAAAQDGDDPLAELEEALAEREDRREDAEEARRRAAEEEARAVEEARERLLRLAEGARLHPARERDERREHADLDVVRADVRREGGIAGVPAGELFIGEVRHVPGWGWVSTDHLGRRAWRHGVLGPRFHGGHGLHGRRAIGRVPRNLDGLYVDSRRGLFAYGDGDFHFGVRALGGHGHRVWQPFSGGTLGGGSSTLRWSFGR